MLYGTFATLMGHWKRFAPAKDPVRIALCYKPPFLPFIHFVTSHFFVRRLVQEKESSCSRVPLDSLNDDKPCISSTLKSPMNY